MLTRLASQAGVVLLPDTHGVSIGNEGTSAESGLSRVRALTQSLTCTDGSLFAD